MPFQKGLWDQNSGLWDQAYTITGAVQTYWTTFSAGKEPNIKILRNLNILCQVVTSLFTNYVTFIILTTIGNITNYVKI